MAIFLAFEGAKNLPFSHLRKEETAVSCGTWKGITLSGAMPAALWSSRTWGLPQKAQRVALSPGPRIVCAPQPWQRTTCLASPHSSAFPVGAVRISYSAGAVRSMSTAVCAPQ